MGEMSREYQKWVREYQDQAWSLARYLLKDASEAEDATQEAFIKLWNHRDSVDPARIKPWLMKVTRNTCLDRLRRRKPETELTEVTASRRSSSNCWLKAFSTSGRLRLTTATGPCTSTLTAWYSLIVGLPVGWESANGTGVAQAGNVRLGKAHCAEYLVGILAHTVGAVPDLLRGAAEPRCRGRLGHTIDIDIRWVGSQFVTIIVFADKNGNRVLDGDPCFEVVMEDLTIPTENKTWGSIKSMYQTD